MPVNVMLLLRPVLNLRFLKSARIFIFLCLTILGTQVYFSISAVRKDFENSCPLFYEKGKGGDKESCFLMYIMFMFMQCFAGFIRTCLYVNEVTSVRNYIPVSVEIFFGVFDFIFFSFCIFSSVVLTNGTIHACRNSSIEVCDTSASWVTSFRAAQYGAWISTAMWFASLVVNVLIYLVEHVDILRRISNGLNSSGTENAVSTGSRCSTEMRVVGETGNLQMPLAEVRDQVAVQGRNGRSRVYTTDA